MPVSETSGSKDVAVAIQEELIRRLGTDRFELWFAKGIRLQPRDAGLEVVSETQFQMERVRKRLMGELQAAACQVYGHPVPVRLRIATSAAEQTDTPQPVPEPRPAVHPSSRPSVPRLNEPRPTPTPRGNRPRRGSHRAATSTGEPQPIAGIRSIVEARHADPVSSGGPAGDERAGKERVGTDRATTKDSPSDGPVAWQLASTSLANFSVGPCNQLAHTAARMVIEQPGSASPLFLWGPPGTGKTHLLAAIRNAFRNQHRLRRVVMLSAEQFTNDFTGAVRGSGLPAFRRRYRDVEALLIDDVQFVGGKRATLRELLYTVDTLLRGRCQLAFTADRPPLELEGLTEELSGRLAGGMVCPLRPLDEATRRKVLETLAARSTTDVDAEVLDRLAAELVGDGRILSGAMNHLRMLSQMLGRPASWDELVESAPDLIAAGRPAVNLGDIQKAVCEMFGLPADSLRSRGQHRSVSQPRMLAMYLARQYTRAAFSEIGEYFGQRSHSTVIAATKRVEDWLADAKPVRRGTQNLPPRQAIEAIENLLRTG